jgi:glycosyltransferase involved in cell wall biosynthesis
MKQPYFSIIIPSYLGAYAGAAENREEKLRRAVRSILGQTLKANSDEDFEIIFVSDGCDRSYEIMEQTYGELAYVYQIPKQTKWSGAVRNFGIEQATGKYIVYLDTDDKFGENHLLNIYRELKLAAEPEWVFFNDYVHNKKTGFVERVCHMNRQHQCGTSNIAHKAQLKVRWGDGYLHDFFFIKKLHRYSYKIIKGAEYYVCHIPNKYDI